MIPIPTIANLRAITETKELSATAISRRARRAAETAQEAREVYDRTDDPRKRENARCAALVASQALSCAASVKAYTELMKDAKWMLAFAHNGEKAYELGY